MPSWQALGEELNSLLSPEEYDSAKRTTFNAFYTSPIVITAMHDAVDRLGVPADATVLEPGCGTGNFMSQAPGGSALSAWSSTASPAGSPAPSIRPDIRIENFRDTKLPEGHIDAVIGNVPFADVKLEYRGQRLPLHDFFFAKSVDALKPGGMLALVTSHFTLDKQNAGLREYLGRSGRFPWGDPPALRCLQAGGHERRDRHRLPAQARPGEPAITPTRHGWRPRRSTSTARPSRSTATSSNHPEMVLGTWSRQDRLYAAGYSLRGDGDLAGQLAAATQRLPEGASPPPKPVEFDGFRNRRAARPSRPRLPTATSPRAVSSSAKTGRSTRSTDGSGSPVTYGGTLLTADGTLTGKRLAGLVGLARPCTPRPPVPERGLAGGQPQRRQKNA